MLLPLVFPQRIDGVVAVNVGPNSDQLRTKNFNLVRIKNPSPVTEERSLLSSLLIGPARQKCNVKLVYFFTNENFFLPDAVNGPDVILGQNAGMGRLSFLPHEAGRYRPMYGEDE